MLDEREKRQKAEARLAEIDLQNRENQARQQQQQLPPEARLQQALYSQNLRTSRRFAERAYGAETVATVHDWVVARCDADPAFNQQMQSSEDPYESAYQAYQREQVLAKVSPTDLADYEAWKAAKAAGSGQPAAQPAAGHPAAASPNLAPPPPPRSLASQPNAGGSGQPEVHVGPGAAHASLFRR
jgi:epoxyqueuosine reductase QueG